MMNITEITSPIPSFNDTTNLFNDTSQDMQRFLVFLTVLLYALQNLLIHDVYLFQNTSLVYEMRASQPAFLDIQGVGNYPQFIWGDVLKGIEELSHNITASLLTMPFGTTTTNCDFYHHDVVYQYSSVALWVPYGVSHFSLLSCYDLTISPLFFTDGLGRCFNFIRCRRHDNGEK
jgi:hypothetical protein